MLIILCQMILLGAHRLFYAIILTHTLAFTTSFSRSSSRWFPLYHQTKKTRDV